VIEVNYSGNSLYAFTEPYWQDDWITLTVYPASGFSITIIGIVVGLAIVCGSIYVSMRLKAHLKSQ
jgi:hypothetical protein